MSLPAEEDVQLLVCDDVRIEINRKLTLNGFFPANRINAAHVGQGFGLPLAFLLIIENGAGNFNLRFSILSPSKVSLASAQAQLNKLPNAPAVHIAKFLNLPIPEIGTYTVELYLDGKKYIRTFTIGEDPSLRSAGQSGLSL